LKRRCWISIGVEEVEEEPEKALSSSSIAQLPETMLCINVQEGEEEEEDIPGVLDVIEADDGTNPTEIPLVSAAVLKENAEKFSADMSARMKDKGDLFDEMVVHEEQIRLGEDGWKARYYQAKTGFPPGEQEEAIKAMVKSYVEGLCWVLRYYYDGKNPLQFEMLECRTNYVHTKKHGGVQNKITGTRFCRFKTFHCYLDFTWTFSMNLKEGQAPVTEFTNSSVAA
jgi:hypothetical protein